MSFLRAYISKRQDGGFVYVAERSEKGNRTFLWSIAPLDIHKPEARIRPSAVPPAIRRKAYKALVAFTLLFWFAPQTNAEPCEYTYQGACRTGPADPTSPWWTDSWWGTPIMCMNTTMVEHRADGVLNCLYRKEMPIPRSRPRKAPKS
jgi:hypothetical protein